VTNPLLETHELPPFTAICAEHVEPAIEKLIEQNRTASTNSFPSLKQSPGSLLLSQLTGAMKCSIKPGHR